MLDWLFVIGVLTFLPFLAYLINKPREKWRPPVLFAILVWLALGNVLPYALGPHEDYQQNYIICIFAIPLGYILLDYLFWRTEKRFYGLIWEKLKSLFRIYKNK
ncbi:MAG: hypothetical protein LBH01_08995 [Verrucomicrobiales bacterium]|nr:hypothetical protein [Verrucomicrobiales bacterium]